MYFQLRPIKFMQCIYTSRIFRKIIFVFLAIVFISLSNCVKEDTPDELGMSDFEELWMIIDIYYPFFEFKNIDWDSIYSVYQPEFVSITESHKISQLGDLMNELKDGHANLMDEEGNYLSSYPTPRGLRDVNTFSYQLVTSYFQNALQEGDDIFRYGILAGNIGYILIVSFPQYENEYRLFDTALDYIRETVGLIIDIRHNGGGSTNASDYFISRLIGEDQEGTIWTNRDGSYRPVIIHHPAGDYQYTKPTVLLINGKSFSTSEAMANLCKKIEHITLIGDTTGGGGGVPDEIFDLPSGLTFRVPTRYALRYDGEQVEWNGIPPDILVTQTEEDIANEHDKQLEAAIELLTEE